MAPTETHVFHQIDKNNRTLAATSATANAALLLESASAIPALIVNDKKLEKKITKHPFGSE